MNCNTILAVVLSELGPSLVLDPSDEPVCSVLSKLNYFSKQDKYDIQFHDFYTENLFKYLF